MVPKIIKKQISAKKTFSYKDCIKIFFIPCKKCKPVMYGVQKSENMIDTEFFCCNLYGTNLGFPKMKRKLCGLYRIKWRRISIFVSFQPLYPPINLFVILCSQKMHAFMSQGEYYSRKKIREIQFLYRRRTILNQRKNVALCNSEINVQGRRFSDNTSQPPISEDFQGSLLLSISPFFTYQKMMNQ